MICVFDTWKLTLELLFYACCCVNDLITLIAELQIGLEFVDNDNNCQVLFTGSIIQPRYQDTSISVTDGWVGWLLVWLLKCFYVYGCSDRNYMVE